MSRSAVKPPDKRLLTRAEAAGYCNISAAAFDSTCPVQPIAFGQDRRLERYDVRALDQWIDRLSFTGSVKTKEQALAELDDDDDGPRRRR